MIHILEHIAVACFAGSLICAAVSDFRHYRIPNIASLVIVAAWPFWVLALEMSGRQSLWWLALIGAAIMFLFGMFLFSRGAMGGGDVKLLAGAVLWAGPLHLFGFTAVSVIAGIALAVFTMLRTAWQGARADSGESAGGGGAAAVAQSVSNMRHVPFFKTKLPYGVAIAAGGLYVAARLVGV